MLRLFAIYLLWNVFKLKYLTLIFQDFHNIYCASNHVRISGSFLHVDGEEFPPPSGLAISRTCYFISISMVAYLLVVLGLACPSQFAIVLRSTPDFKR